MAVRRIQFPRRGRQLFGTCPRRRMSQASENIGSRRVSRLTRTALFFRSRSSRSPHGIGVRQSFASYDALWRILRAKLDPGGNVFWPGVGRFLSRIAHSVRSIRFVPSAGSRASRHAVHTELKIVEPTEEPHVRLQGDAGVIRFSIPPGISRSAVLPIRTAPFWNGGNTSSSCSV